MGVCNCNITNTISAHITSEFLMPISDKNSNDIKNQISESSIQTKPVSLIQSPRGKEITKIQRKTTKKLIKVTKISRKASITGFLAQIAASIANQPISCTALVQSYKNKFTKPVRKTKHNRRRTFSSFTRKYNTIIPTEKSNKNLPNAELITSNTKNQFKDNLNVNSTLNVNEVKANENNSKDILKIGSSLIRSKSFLNQDPSLRLSPKSQINEDEEEVSNLNKLNDKLNYCLSLRELTNEEEISIRTTLSNNTAFFGLNDKHIKLMSDCFNLYELNNDVCIFKEKEDSNHFFLIASGKVELKTNNEVKILTREDSFGEISFFNATKKKRTYSAYTLSKVQIFSFCVEDFKNTLKTKGEDFQEIFFKNESLKEKYRNDFYNFYLFQYLPLDIKEQLFSLSKIIILNQSNTLLVSSFSSLKKSSFIQTKKPFLNHPKHLIFPMEGSNSLIEKFQQSDQHKRIQKGNVAGLIYTFFKSNIVFEYEVYTCSNSCICLVLSDEMLRECIGVDYSKEILFSFFKNKIKLSTELIPYLITKSCSDKKENEDLIYRKLFNDFSIEEYKINDTIVSKSVTCDKYVLTLNEDIFNQRSSQIFTSKGNFYGEEIINHHQL